MGYEITGTFKGRPFRTSGSYEFLLKMFIANNFKSLWHVDENNKRKLLKRNKDAK